MKIFKNTYRFFAAIVLVLLFCTSLVPSGLAAASLHCDRQVTNKMSSCCTQADMNSHNEERDDTQNCDEQAFCEHLANNLQAANPALVQTTKVTFDLELLSRTLVIKEDHSDKSDFYKEESLSSNLSPPIFLLNSTFLN